jgi:OOP family OmpA-OmpF porin
MGALALTATTAQAADETGKWYINPQVGYLWTDSDRFVDDDLYYGFGIGKHLSPEWSLEINGVGSNYDAEAGGGDLDITAFSIDALRVFKRAATVSPFLSVGAGYIKDEPSGGRDFGSALAQVGAGLLIDVAGNSSGSFLFQLRPEVKARWDFIDERPNDNFVDYMAGIGFQFAWGSPRPAPVPVTATPPPPPPPPPPPAPKDSDGDGVLDPADQCPDTPRGTAVDALGCPRKGSVTLKGVNFEFNSATLTGDSRPLLDEVATDLKKHPRLRIEMEGHTDSVGADAYNLKLSQQRADAVRQYLVSQGVAASQLTAKGYGEARPLADNKTADGRAENRRVAMQVIDNPGDVEVKGQESR